MTSERQSERRLYPRVSVSWPVVVETNRRVLHLETVNISTRGTKVTPKERLREGTRAELHFHPPDHQAFDVPALVWRADPDGVAFFFVSDSPLDVASLQAGQD